MEAFGYNAADEEILVWGPRWEGDDRGVEFLLRWGLGGGNELGDVLDDVREADVVCVGIWLLMTL